MNAAKTTRKSITLSEEEATQLKNLADGFQISESDFLKEVLSAILDNKNGTKILMAQEKTAYSAKTIIKEGVSRYAEQLISQTNIGSRNNELAQAYEIIKSSGEKYRSITSKLANAVGTNYKTALRWLKENHPEEVKDKEL